MLNSFFRKLNEPFPERQQGLKKVKEIFFTALFVALFLYLFNPFGLQNMPEGVGFSASIFGVITFVFYLFFHWFVGSVLKLHTDIPSWTLWKWIVSMMAMTLWISIGNFAFLIFSLPNNFSLGDFPKMLQYTVMVGITPTAISGLLIQVNGLKKHLDEAKDFSNLYQDPLAEKHNESRRVEFEISNGENLSIATGAIHFIEAMQNYLMVHHEVGQPTQVKQTMVRLTMTKAAILLNDSSMLRCHRSFIINTQKVAKVSGNAQGLKLALVNLTDREIPVSRRYIPLVKDALLSSH